MEKIKKVMEDIKKDPDLRKKFETDPKGVLKQKGIDTESLKIEKIDPKHQPKGSTCVSIGEIIGFSIG